MDRSDGLTEEELLAHIRGQSTPEQAARIEAAADADPALRAELSVMAGLKDALGASTDGPDTRIFGWKRLEAEIKSTQTAAPRTRGWQMIAAALGTVALLQGAYIAFVPQGGGAPLFRTVSEESARFGLGIAFAPSASAAEIETLLRDTGARIVDGPSAIGLYRVAFQTEEARATAQSAFDASPLIELVAEE
ncbi:hypothetical protein [Thalassococcus sp. S3]|uniref:hypothetical protein n=1 Tax=Thalassococcus sp. S3 TaxID=2017482 RepID=UPI00102413B1|nr:hypothetical protein [Thalassococcus sp. S3]QBF32634.1 hypothetical protein CFI11_15620 [Thalassococcus sp. S3]